MMETASHNLIKETAALKQKKGREESGLLLVESRHPVEEALRAGLTLERLFIREGAPLPGPEFPVARCFQVDEAGMHRLGTTDSAPPWVGVFQKPQAMAKLPTEAAFVLLMDGLQDPGNLGTLIRSALAFGVDAVALTPGSVEIFSPKVIRASAGLVFALPVLQLPLTAIAEAFAGENWRRYATVTGNAQAVSYHEADYGGHCLMVLGNEGHGISDELQSMLSLAPLTIPMSDRVESLNVAVSGSIILAHAAFQRSTRHERTPVL